MAYNASVPAQRRALAYLEAVAARTRGPLIVGGHSKGANLAAFAALKASPEIQSRIEQVYLHDGPGFKPGAIDPGEWERLAERMHRTVPQESLVGMLMECPIAPHVVSCSDTRGIDQHSVFTWDIAGTDFSYIDTVTERSAMFQAVTDEWLSRYTDREAVHIVEALFRAIEASGISNASEVFFSGIKIVPFITRASHKLDSDSRDILKEALASLADVTARHARRGIASRLGRREKKKLNTKNKTSWSKTPGRRITGRVLPIDELPRTPSCSERVPQHLRWAWRCKCLRAYHLPYGGP